MCQGLCEAQETMYSMHGTSGVVQPGGFCGTYKWVRRNPSWPQKLPGEESDRETHKSDKLLDFRSQKSKGMVDSQGKGESHQEKLLEEHPWAGWIRPHSRGLRPAAWELNPPHRHITLTCQHLKTWISTFPGKLEVLSHGNRPILQAVISRHG